MSEKNKTIFIILDGLDYRYIENNRKKYPFFDELINGEKLLPLDSVVPADSIPSWTTIYTGLNPAEHGVLESIDYLDFKHKVKGDYSAITGKSFFDRLGNKGKKVLVYNPFMAYPAWKVNGVMVCGPVFEGGDVSVYGDVDKEKLPPLGGLVDHPTKKTMKKFYEDTVKLTEAQFDGFLELYEKDDYDLGFLGVTTPDRIQHFLWRYCDETDVTFVKNSPLKNAIAETYAYAEKRVSEIFEKYGDRNVIVISDHGHGKRCEKTFYVNRFLIKEGFIPQKSFKKRATEWLKNATFRFLAKTRSVERGTRFFKKFRFAHKVKNADYVFNNDAKIYAPKFDGVNPFGGISVNESKCADGEYEKLRTEIIEKLLAVRDGDKKVVLWAKRREDIYDGCKARNYPDVVYRMDENYGADRGLFGKRLFGINPTHEIVSGGHRFTGVIMSNREDVKEITSVLQIHDYVIKVTGGKDA